MSSKPATASRTRARRRTGIGTRARRWSKRSGSSRHRRSSRVALTGSARGLLPEKDPRVAPRLARSQRLRAGAVEVLEHRLLVAGEALRTQRTFRRALLWKATEADEREPAALEELRHQRQREHPPQTEVSRLLDAGIDERLPHPAARRLRPHRERADLGEVVREDRERAAPREAGVLGDEVIAQVLVEELARARQHEVPRGVRVDELAHRV